MDVLGYVPNKLESMIREYREWLPFIGRILLVLTNIEDGVRLAFNFSEQSSFLMGNHVSFPFPTWLAFMYLSFSLFAQLVGSSLIVANKKMRFAAGLLLVFKFSILIIYGFSMPAWVHAQGRYRFLTRVMSISGGLCMLIAHDMYQEQRQKGYFAGLPGLMEPSQLATYLQTAGRFMLAFQFAGMFNYGWVVGLIMMAPAVLVAVGFKTRYASLFLGLVLFIESTMGSLLSALMGTISSFDSTVYFMCQDLSILGGVILLASLGPGGISLDSRKSL